ncbi:glycosyl transferase family protein [Lacticaseibacillus brantae DSM 23927]|uniref:Glycosyl transferase family protein n=2 Tax=Lacticaseibacillus brantae TaxID=943673 RepID=A0A0R2B003_9LACO|nr:glycosyl transferase family protein [Lacticaseibacillus brantae DSM 23927]
MFEGVVLSTLSLLKHQTEPLNIFVMTAEVAKPIGKYTGFTDVHINQLEWLVHEHDTNSTVTKLDITDLLQNYPLTANATTFFTPYSMLRLYADLVPQLQGRVLYLDADVLCRQSFAEFYHQNLAEIEVVGVLDFYGKWFFHHQLRKFDYINSGVLLMNLDVLRQTKLLQRCRRLCRYRPMLMPDQSALNMLAHNKRLAPSRFNAQNGIEADTVFHHFSANWVAWPVPHTVAIKPWEQKKVQTDLGLHDYDDLYAEAKRIIH